MKWGVDFLVMQLTLRYHCSGIQPLTCTPVSDPNKLNGLPNSALMELLLWSVIGAHSGLRR